MLRQIKLLSLITVSMSCVVTNAAMDPFSYVKSLWGKPQDLGTMAVAAILGNIAYSVSQREYNDKGDFRTIGNDEADPMLTRALYCAAAGTGVTAIEHSWSDKNEEISVQDRVVKSLVNAVALFCTEYAADQDVYRSLNRNHPLFRGWLPFNAKFDDIVKKTLVFSTVRSALQSLKNLSIATPAA